MAWKILKLGVFAQLKLAIPVQVAFLRGPLTYSAE